ncbi:MAG: OadG family protein [Acetatifactor sp.]|nr:OadG family protein [Acetatifactor sp.]
MSNNEIETLLTGVDGHGLKTVLESFYLGQKNTGKLLLDENGTVIYSDYKAERNDDQILARAAVKCENGDADVELIFSNDLLITLVGGSLNARSTFGELMEKAALNTVIGMGTVFAVLILISLIIACFGFIPKIQAAFAKKEEAPAAPAAPVVTAAPEVIEEEADDTELVAVIAAAIAAYEGSTNTDGFVVRSIRRR